MKRLISLACLLIAALTLNAFSAESYTKVPIPGGEIHDMAICYSHPDVIYVCSGYGGVWVSLNGGDSWEETNFYISPSPDNTLEVAGGASHVAVKSDDPSIVIASQFGSFNNGMLRSTDYGDTWNLLAKNAFDDNIHIVDLIASRTNNNTFFLLGYDFTEYETVFYKSTDAGNNWTKTNNIGSGKAAWDFCVNKNDDIYVSVIDKSPAPDLAFDDSVGGWIYKSTDMGNSFSMAYSTNTSPEYISCSSNTVAVTVGNFNGILISTTAAQSFVNKSGSYDEVAVSTCGTRVYAFNNRIAVSSNTGSGWSNLVNISTGMLDGQRSIWATELIINPQNPDIFYMTDFSKEGFIKSTDTAVTWNNYNEGLDALIVYDGCKDPSENIYMLGRRALYKSSDNGETWEKAFDPELYGDEVDFEKGAVAAPADNLIFVEGYGNLWRSPDNGQTWSKVLSVNSNYEAAQKIVFDPNNTTTGYVAFREVNASSVNSEKFIYKSTDSGKSWTPVNLKLNSVHALAMDPDNSDILYAGLGDRDCYQPGIYSYGGLWKIDLSDDTPSKSKIGLDDTIPYRIVFDDDKRLIVSYIDKNDPYGYKSSGYTYYSEDNGSTWTQIALDKVGFGLTTDFEYSDGVYYHCNEGAIFAANSIYGTFKTLAEKKDIGQPRCLIVGSMYTGANRGLYRLNWTTEYSGNETKAYAFPNPFKAGVEQTTIKYFVPEGKDANSLEISIYNIAGELVKEYPKQNNLDGGKAYYFRWDGKNENGNMCAHGAYIAVFRSSIDTARTKIILQK